MKYIKKFENINDIIDIEKIIPREEIYDVFEIYSLSCDPKQNKSLNGVEYNNKDNLIICNFTCYTYDGRAPLNILDRLKNIMRNIYANDFSFGNYNKFGSYLVTFKYNNKRLKDIEIKKDIKKYNL